MKNAKLITKPFIIDSGIPGPTVLILGGIHGNELCGIDVIDNLISGDLKLDLTCGKVIAAFGNIEAIQKNKRFITHNLNRLFTNNLTTTNCTCSEHLRATELKKLMDQADVLLDIHASFTPETSPFIICERNALPYIQSMRCEKICFGFDAIQPGGTDFYMNKIGKIGICLECGYLSDDKGANIAIEALLSLLDQLGMQNMKQKKMSEKKYYQAQYQYYSKSNFIVEKNFPDFDQIQKGEIVGKDGDEIINARKDGYLMFASNKNKPNEEAFVFLTNTNG